MYGIKKSLEYTSWAFEKRAQKTVSALKKHGFDAHFYNTGEDAATSIVEMVKEYDSFGFPGSATTRELGLVDALKAKGKKIFDHWDPALSKEAVSQVRDQQLFCDCLFLSANAISMTGEIINVDGVGNRVAAMSYGPQKVVIIAGMNKVTSDLHAALRRVREFAGPMRAKSLTLDTPCAESGVCVDCNHPQRICRITTIMHRKPMATDISVILIQDSLGF